MDERNTSLRESPYGYAGLLLAALGFGATLIGQMLLVEPRASVRVAAALVIAGLLLLAAAARWWAGGTELVLGLVVTSIAFDAWSRYVPSDSAAASAARYVVCIGIGLLAYYVVQLRRPRPRSPNGA